MENFYDHSNSESLTKSNSTADIYEDVVINPSIHVNQDTNKVSYLIEKELAALAEGNKLKYQKQSFTEIKNNVQMIQHNLDNFFVVITNKKPKKERKESKAKTGLDNY